MKLFLLFILTFTVNAQGNSGNEATTVDCEDPDEFTYQIEPIGSSTQFRIYDLCDDTKWIKVKMNYLTELDSNGEKTTNKEVGFAATKGWVFGDGSGTGELQDPCSAGNDGSGACLYNVFNATSLKKTGASFALQTWFALDDIWIEEGSGDEVIVNNIGEGSLKWGVIISDWPWLGDEGNTLELCVSITTTEDDVSNVAEIENESTAQCITNADPEDQIDVTYEEISNGWQLDICYSFAHCDGQIVYDPIITMYADGVNMRSVILLFIIVFIMSALY